MSQEYRVHVSLAEASAHLRVSYRNVGEDRFSVLAQSSFALDRPSIDPAVLASSIQRAIAQELTGILPW